MGSYFGLVPSLIGLFTIVVSNWATWFFTRRKYNSEVDNTVINNLKDAVNTYQLICDDNKRRLEEAYEEIRDLRKQVNDLMMSICYDLTCSARQKLSRTVKTEDDETD